MNAPWSLPDQVSWSVPGSGCEVSTTQKPGPLSWDAKLWIYGQTCRYMETLPSVTVSIYLVHIRTCAQCRWAGLYHTCTACPYVGFLRATTSKADNFQLLSVLCISPAGGVIGLDGFSHETVEMIVGRPTVTICVCLPTTPENTYPRVASSLGRRPRGTPYEYEVFRRPNPFCQTSSIPMYAIPSTWRLEALTMHGHSS